jgi:hypothetical protein
MKNTDTASHAEYDERAPEDRKEERSEPSLLDLLQHLQRLERQNQAYEEACAGPDPDVPALDWLSALLTEIDGDHGVMGEAMKRSADPQALYHAFGESCRLLRNLQAACARATGEE